ncbi:hypothetical protein NQ318_020853 [Aromia moschata]|uniref:MIF4G domain-containing protein n=1 Tax=Aromia moschata TaxID=1265417 RepID=A0AAV8XIB2_9CUCU|nr:hypothetical protein NQ318_020853 [Aromia moschata]
MESKPVLWDKNSDVLQPLRQPNIISNLPERYSTRQRNDESDTNIINSNRNAVSSVHPVSNPQTPVSVKGAIKLEDIVAKSTLKVDAPEWYPSNVNPNVNAQLPASNVQDRLKVHKKSHEPDLQSLSLAEKGYPSNVSVEQCTVEDSVDIIRLKQIINTLTKDPGQFDNLLDLFMETLFPYFEDIIAISLIAQLLVEQLYAQLPHSNVYGALLIDCIKQLLYRGGNDDIKCICQALKLTGHSLEQSNKTSLDEVFSQLKSFPNTLNGSVTALMNSVINLRNSNWGYSSDSSNNVEPVPDAVYFEGLQNTVFYHTDGHTFTSEEKEFLAAHMDSNAEYLSDNSDPGRPVRPRTGKWDEEIQAAFKDFVKFSRH